MTLYRGVSIKKHKKRGYTPRILDFDVSVSSYSSLFDNKEKNVNLFDWLKDDIHYDKILQIRRETDQDERKKLKSKLPGITPSGIFHPERRADNLVSHSGLMAIDIDNVDPKRTKDVLSDVTNFLFLQLSASGRGLWGLMPIKYPDRHKEHFEYIANELLKRKGVSIDKSGSDVSRFRYYSYDPDPYWNLNAKPIEIYVSPKKRKRKKGTSPSIKTKDATDISALINKIIETRTDITYEYQNWIGLGFYLRNEFGEQQGKEYYHALSQFHPNYTQEEVEKKWRSFKGTSSGNPWTAGSIIYLARQHGVIGS